MNISTPNSSYHRPVLLRETLDALSIGPGDRCIDATVGDGGHTMSLLEATGPNGQLLGIDADPKALERARERLHPFAGRLTLVNDNFANLENIVARNRFYPVLAILMDLGLSSWQLEDGGRGFSFREEVPLDMRLSPTQPINASDLVNAFTTEDLAKMIATYGEEPQARRIARSIVYHRPIQTALELAQAIEAAVPRRGRRLHPATRAFLAIRIVVNKELENLESALSQALRVLTKGGRLAVIAYHSLEDRIVKTFMRREAKDCICPPEQPQCICGHRATLTILNRKVIKPGQDEIRDNPRARSARLRVCSALGQPVKNEERVQVEGGSR